MTSADLNTWSVSLPPQPATKEHQSYTTAAFAFHDVTLATVSVFEETTAPNDFGFVRCSLYFTSNADIAAGPWRALGARAGGDDLIALGPRGAFDYGLCYAAAPLGMGGGLGANADPSGLMDRQARLYYWGVDGQHYAPHNASFGMATIPARRMAGVRVRGEGVALVRTVDINCTASRLIVTVDTNIDNTTTSMVALDRVRAQVAGVGDMFGFAASNPITGMNVTDMEMTWGPSNQRDLTRFIGRRIVIEFELTGHAAFYSFGFAN